MMCVRRDGLPQDFQRAAQWVSLAAGYSRRCDFQFTPGNFCLQGRDIVHDYDAIRKS